MVASPPTGLQLQEPSRLGIFPPTLPTFFLPVGLVCFENLVGGFCGLGLCRLPMILALCISDLQFVEPTTTLTFRGSLMPLSFCLFPWLSSKILALFRYVLVDNRLGWVGNDTRCWHHTSGGGPAECCEAMPSGCRCCWRVQSSQSTQQFSHNLLGIT